MPDTYDNLSFDTNGSLHKASEAATKGGYIITDAPPTDNTVPSPDINAPQGECLDFA